MGEIGELATAAAVIGGGVVVLEIIKAWKAPAAPSSVVVQTQQAAQSLVTAFNWGIDDVIADIFQRPDAPLPVGTPQQYQMFLQQTGQSSVQTPLQSAVAQYSQNTSWAFQPIGPYGLSGGL